MKLSAIRLKRLNADVDMDKAIEVLGISKSAFYKIEQGHLKPSRDVIAKMAKLYDCSIDELYKALKIN